VDSLASADESAQIAEIREQVAGELKVLAAKGWDFPHTTGDLFLLRVLRGNDWDVQKAADWYRTCLKLRQEYGLDLLHLKLEAEDIPFRCSAMPNASKFAEYSTTIFDADVWKNLNGDLVIYDAFGDLDTRGLVRDLGWSGCKQFFITMLEKQLAVLDRMSRQQGRLVKVVRIMDLQGLSMWTYDKEALALLQRDIAPISAQAQCQVMRECFIINTPWLGLKLYGWLKWRLPERTQRVMHFIGKDYLEDENVQASISAENIDLLTAQRRTGNDDEAVGKPGTDRLVRKGEVFEQTIEVSCGQTISWCFQLGSFSGDDPARRRGLMGRILDTTLGEVTDVSFSVVAFWTDEQDSGPDSEPSVEELVSPESIDASAGRVTGSVTIANQGLLAVRWSNYHSWVRHKMLMHYLVTVEAAKQVHMTEEAPNVESAVTGA